MVGKPMQSVPVAIQLTGATGRGEPVQHSHLRLHWFLVGRCVYYSSSSRPQHSCKGAPAIPGGRQTSLTLQSDLRRLAHREAAAVEPQRVDGQRERKAGANLSGEWCEISVLLTDSSNGDGLATRLKADTRLRPGVTGAAACCWLKASPAGQPPTRHRGTRLLLPALL